MTDTTREQQLSALSAENEFLKAENERLRQQNELLRKAVFGPKSEKKAISDTAMNGGEQICLFNEAEIESRQEEDDPVTVPAHKRKKKRSRAEIIGELPVEEVVHKVEDKTCDLCGSEMKPVGKEFVHDELVYVPAKLFVRKHYVEVVKCVNCGTDESRDAEQPDDIEKEHFRKAAAPSLLIPRSFCSPELLAHIIYEKYCNAMPLYRQEQDFRAHGVELSRTTMANWSIRIAEEKAKPVFDAMKAELLAGSVIHADETTVQVLHEEGRKAKTKSRMWVYCNAKADGKYMALYDYRPTRAGANAADFLGSFSGCIVCDGYDGYNKLGSGISRAGCWAHARRKFIEAEPTDPELKKSSAAAEGVNGATGCLLLNAGVTARMPTAIRSHRQYHMKNGTDIVRRSQSLLLTLFSHGLKRSAPQVVQRWQRRCSMLSMKRNICTPSSPILALRSATTVPRMPSDHLWWDARTGSFPILQREQPPAQCCIL